MCLVPRNNDSGGDEQQDEGRNWIIPGLEAMVSSLSCIQKAMAAECGYIFVTNPKSGGQQHTEVSKAGFCMGTVEKNLENFVNMV